jgi:putative ABC transport system substrate-binding protein
MKIALKTFAFVICSLALFFDLTSAANISVVSDFDNESSVEIVAGLQSYLAAKNIQTSLIQYLIEKEDPAALTQKINSRKNDIIFVIGRRSLDYAAKNFSAGTPVVFTVVADYKVDGGKEIAGITLQVPNDKKAVAIKEVLPNASRVGVIYSNSFQSKTEGLQQAIEKNGMKYVENTIDSEQDFSHAVENMFPNIDCFVVLPDDKIYFSTTVKLLLLQSAKMNIPIVGLSKYFTQMGALMSVECDYTELGKQSGRIVERILAGESAGSIGVEAPRKFRISLNLKTAQKYGKKIPQEVIDKAKPVYQ